MSEDQISELVKETLAAVGLKVCMWFITINTRQQILHKG